MVEKLRPESGEIEILGHPPLLNTLRLRLHPDWLVYLRGVFFFEYQKKMMVVTKYTPLTLVIPPFYQQLYGEIFEGKVVYAYSLGFGVMMVVDRDD